MKLTKTAVAVAVTTGFVALPMAASAETTLSGLVQIKVQGSDADVGEEAPDDGDLNMAAGDIRLAINSQNEIVGGLTGYGNIQFNLDNLTGEGGVVIEELGTQEDTRGGVDTTATVAADNVYVGVKGGFGDVRIGEIPLAVEYGQVANDIFDIGADVVDGISYVGAFGPVGIVANYALEGPNPGGAIDPTAVDNDLAGDSDMAGIGARFTFGGATIGAGYELRNLSGDEVGNAAVGISFAIAGFSIGAHYALLEANTGQVDFTLPDEGIVAETSDATVAAFQIGYAIAGVNLGLTYQLASQDDFDFELSPEDEDDVVVGGGQDFERSAIRFDAGYDLGGGLDISTRITAFSNDGDFETNGFDDGFSIGDDLTEYRVQLTKNF